MLVKEPNPGAESIERRSARSDDRGRIAVKFTALGGDAIGKEQCEKLQHCVMNLENAAKLDELLELTIA